MNLLIKDRAKDDLKKFDKHIQKMFLDHFDKLLGIPPRRHLKHGIPVHTEKITKQARFVYDYQEDTLMVFRCFWTHKEYENWYHGDYQKDLSV